MLAVENSDEDAAIWADRWPLVQMQQVSRRKRSA
jgi:hypothetical protein